MARLNSASFRSLDFGTRRGGGDHEVVERALLGDPAEQDRDRLGLGVAFDDADDPEGHPSGPASKRSRSRATVRNASGFVSIWPMRRSSPAE